MPPAGGMGVGIDRLMMILSGADAIDPGVGRVKVRAVTTLLTQHGGYTSKGFAAEVQAEIERLEREGDSAGMH